MGRRPRLPQLNPQSRAATAADDREHAMHDTGTVTATATAIEEQGSIGLVAECMNELGLAPGDVFRSECADGEATIITQGGTRIVWPRDRQKFTDTPLTQSQRDGIVRSVAHIGDTLRRAAAAAKLARADK